MPNTSNTSRTRLQRWPGVVFLRALLVYVAVSVGGVGTAIAGEQPVVVTDLPITHSLVSIVMGDTGSPRLLIKGSASPHNYSLKPSEAASLQDASLVVWIGGNLTPWLERTLAIRDMEHIELMRAPDSFRLGFRTFDSFAHKDEHSHDSHQHDAASIDPHGWLNPDNRIYWLELIAEKLATLSPEHAVQYRQNALEAQTTLSALAAGIKEQLAPVKGQPFIVFHDSYHYFEQYFDIHAQASIALGDSELPGIRRMNALRQQLSEYDQACIFKEPQFSERMVNTLIRGLSVNVGTLDPLGASLTIGPDLYPQVLSGIANALENCLSS